VLWHFIRKYSPWRFDRKLLDCDIALVSITHSFIAVLLNVVALPYCLWFDTHYFAQPNTKMQIIAICYSFGFNLWDVWELIYFNTTLYEPTMILQYMIHHAIIFAATYERVFQLGYGATEFMAFLCLFETSTFFLGPRTICKVLSRLEQQKDDMDESKVAYYEGWLTVIEPGFAACFAFNRIGLGTWLLYRSFRYGRLSYLMIVILTVFVTLNYFWFSQIAALILRRFAPLSGKRGANKKSH
jgi:hypothetical protein